MSLPQVSLLATIFGDLAVLGTGRVVRDHAGRDLASIDAKALAEMVAARHPDCVHPSLAQELNDLVDCAGSPLLLLNAPVSADQWLLQSRFPMSVFTAPAEGDPSTWQAPIADAHLHSGASVPPHLFIENLVAQKDPVAIKTLAPALWTASGAQWNSAILIAALRTALRLIWLSEMRSGVVGRDLLSQHGFHDAVFDQVLSGSYWSDVKGLATMEAGEEGVPPACTAWNRSHRFWGRPNIRGMLWRSPASMQWMGTAGESFLLDTARVMVAVGLMLTPRRGEGLNEFVARSRLVRQAWKVVHSDPEDRESAERLLRWTLGAVAPTDSVVGAEFRKTIRPSTVKKFEKELLGWLRHHVAAFADFQAGRAPIALTMPVGFQRKPTEDGCGANAGWGELAHVMAGCEALRRVAMRIDGQGPAILRTISAFDVAGLEIGSTNWPFVLGAEILSTHNDASLVYSIHSGESFLTELNGVRRVGELFLGEVTPQRIGHALALHAKTAAAIVASGRPRVRRWDAIMDLAWAATAGIADDDAMDALHSLILPQPGSPYVAVDHWIEAYQWLYSLEKMRPFLRDSPFWSPRRPKEINVLATESLSLRALAALAYGAGPTIAGCNVHDVLDGNALSLYLAADQRLAPAARTHVIELVRAGSIIEACPTSNLVISGLKGYDHHPLVDLSELIKYSISTDDPLMFGSCIVDEFAAVAEVCSAATLTALRRQSVENCSGGQHDVADSYERHRALLEAL